MAPTAECRYGGRCTSDGCTFSHPAWVACGKFGEKRCRDKSMCANAKCGFAHPADWFHLQQQQHPTQQVQPRPWAEGRKFGDKRCRDGAACPNAKCGFAHPADWAHGTLPVSPSQPSDVWVPCGKFGERRCREGGSCRNAACGFAHPRDWVHFHGTMLDGGHVSGSGTPSKAAASPTDEGEQVVAGLSGLVLGEAATMAYPPPFIATNFTTRSAYDAWLSSGADRERLPAPP
jgi:hypothetical protein